MGVQKLAILLYLNYQYFQMLPVMSVVFVKKAEKKEAVKA